MSEGVPLPSTATRMRLRYAGRCSRCGAAQPAGETALYERASRAVICLACAETHVTVPDVPEDVMRAAEPAVEATGRMAGGAGPEPVVASPDPVVASSEPVVASPEPVVASPEPVIAGAAGASAQREYERRRDRREERVRTAHPRIGGFLLAISEEPQSTRAWATGARGEELLGKHLDALAAKGVRSLHDRRIPHTKANIDHIAVSPAGVFVIDAKRYKGRPTLRVEGGLLRPRTEKLMVGTRDQTKLVAGVQKQVDLVRGVLAGADLAELPVRGVLCFVEADWPLFGGSFAIDGIAVLWPKKLTELLVAGGSLDDAAIDRACRALAAAFPPA